MIEARLDAFLDDCKACDARIVWANGPGGHHVPLQADMDAIHEHGNWALDITEPVPGSKRLYAQLPSSGQAAGMRQAGVVLYHHHALHCPRRQVWYRAGQHGPASRHASGKRR